MDCDVLAPCGFHARVHHRNEWFCDMFQVAMPLNWEDGDKVIVPPPKSLDDLNERLEDDSIERTTWYHSKKSL